MSFGAELPEAASVAAVHESALRVLERTGVLVQDDEAVALLRARGARCDGRRVYLDEDVVQAALAAAPSSFVLAGRRPELGLPLGGADGRVFGSGSGAAYMPRAARCAPARWPTSTATAKLGHQLPAIDFNSDCMEPLDLPEDVRTRRGTHARLDAERQGDRVGRLGRRGRRRRRAHQRDPLRRGLARAPARPDRAEHHLAAADLRGDGADPAALGPAGTAGVRDGLRHGRHHRPGDARRRARRAARRGARRARARRRRRARARRSSTAACSAMASLRTGAALFGAPEFARLARRDRAAGAPAAACRCAPARPSPTRTRRRARDGGVRGGPLGRGAFAGAHFLFQAAGMLSSFNALSLEKYVLDADLITALRAPRSTRAAPARTTSPRTSSTRSVPAAATSARRTRAGTRVTTSASALQAARGVRALGRGGRRGRRRRRRPPRPGPPRRARAAGRPRRGHAAAARQLLPGMRP